MTRGSLVGKASVLMGEACPTNFKAIERCQLVRINGDVLCKYLQDNPHLYKIIIESLSQKLLSTMDEFRQTSGHSEIWRVCNIILMFAQQYGVETDGKICIDTDMAQQNIAFLLYLNRITVVRVFKLLQDHNLLEKADKRYYITDTAAFTEFMDKHKYNSRK